MKIKPMLGDFELDGIEYIESSESRALVEHSVPGLAGNYFQDMGTVPNTIIIVGNVGKDPEGSNQSAAQAVTLDEYWIDQYPVTNLDFQQYTPEWTIPSGKDNHPAIGVAWEQADAYCRALNKRLPSEAEWEAAARGSGPDPQLYPWGRDAALALELPNQTYEVGTQTFNVSPLGVYDMFGNVYEWVGEPYGKLTAGNRILRGVRYSLPYDLAFRLEVAPTDANYVQHAGFRCAASQVSQ